MKQTPYTRGGVNYVNYEYWTKQGANKTSSKASLQPINQKRKDLNAPYENCVPVTYVFITEVRHWTKS